MATTQNSSPSDSPQNAAFDPASIPVPPQAPAINMMDPAIQAEIARQVALALQQGREDRYYASAVKKQTRGPRLVMFPGKGHDRA
jgi:hypothetical protein